MNIKFQSLISLSFFLTLLACNIPVEQVEPPGDVQTAAALTVQALLITPSVSATSPATVIPNTPSATGMPTEKTTSTPTYSVPMLTIRESTNCRTGPGEAYEIVFTYLSGKKLEIAGRYDSGNYWLVKSSESPTGTCWLWGEFVDVAGSYWAVASVTPPPTSTARPPQAATLLEWTYQCEGRKISFAVTWRDNANNEAGYRIFRNGEPLVELPYDSTTFAESFTPPEDLGATYAIQVYGPGGSAITNIGSMRCD